MSWYVERGAQDRILARLAAGPLPCRQFLGLASSANTLRVQVMYLRRKGHAIRTVRPKGHKGEGYWELEAPQDAAE